MSTKTKTIPHDERRLSHAQVEAQIAALEEKIALLQGEGRGAGISHSSPVSPWLRVQG